jgi:hypothetical protein
MNFPIIFKGTDLEITIKLVEDNEAIDIVADLSNLRVLLRDSQGNEREKYSLDTLAGYLSITAADQTTNKGEFSFPLNRALTAMLPEGNLIAELYYEMPNAEFEDGDQVSRQNITIGIIR